MKKTLLAVAFVLTTQLFGAMEIENLSAKLQVGKTLEGVTLNDQFDKKQTVSKDTKKVIFAFNKDKGHLVNGYLSKREKEYLQSNKIVFIADISKMPSIIAYLFAIPNLKEYGYPIMLIEDEEVSSHYQNKEYRDYVAIVELKDLTIESITLIQTEDELIKILKN